MAGYGGGQCNRRRVSDKAGLWHGHLPHLMSHNPFSLSVCATECHSSGPVVQLSISLKEGAGSSAFASRSRSASGFGNERGTDRTFCKICLKGTGLKDRHSYVWRVTFWAALRFACLGKAGFGAPAAAEGGFHRQSRANFLTLATWRRRLRGPKACTCI